MLIGLTGATGFIGRHILRHAGQRGHEIVAFTRRPDRRVEGAVETREFSLERPPEFRGCEAVVHLAGEPVAGLWTESKKRRIFESRVEGTRRVVEAIAAMPEKPEVLLNASAIGIYHGGEEPVDEDGAGGDDFLANTVRAWEAEAVHAAANRVIRLRTAVALGRDGGALALMKPAFRLGLGGVIGGGRQWMSWIHVEDLARLAIFCLEDMSIRGPVNATAPWPVRHGDFVRTLARALHRPAIFRIPAFAVKLALRGLSAEVLGSKRIVPEAATRHGFSFLFPELEAALRDLA